jgi:hypothetical protein
MPNISKRRSILFHFFLVAIGFSIPMIGAELYLRKAEERNRLVEFERAPIFQNESEFGGSARHGSSGEEIMRSLGRVVNRAFYSIDSYGYRLVPGRNSTSSRCVALFGDSITFGMGVNDDRTAAALLQKSLPTVRVFNFGFLGWGPNQTLRLLELNREEPQLSGCKQVRSFYFSMPDHVARSAGKFYTGLSGPRYTLVNGSLKHSGQLQSPWVLEFRQRFLSDWFLGRSIFDFCVGIGRQPNDQDLERYQRILIRISEILRERYQSNLTIFFTRYATSQKIAQSLSPGSGMQTIYFEDQEYNGWSYRPFQKEFLLPDHIHPNEAGHRRIASLLLAGSLSDWLPKKQKAPEPKFRGHFFPRGKY